MIKFLESLGIKRTFLNIISINSKPIASADFNGETLNTIPLKSGTKQKMFNSYLFNIVIEVFDIVLNLKNKTLGEKGIKLKRKKSKHPYFQMI